LSAPPITHPAVSGQGNIGHGHKAFASGASVMPVPIPRPWYAQF
jgi:hypothetical protein